MRKTISITFRLLFNPLSLIKNRKVRLTLRVLLGVWTAKRYIDAYEKAQRDAAMNDLHMLYVDNATQIIYTDADEEFLHSIGIDS